MGNKKLPLRCPEWVWVVPRRHASWDWKRRAVVVVVGGYYVFFTRTIILISISYCAWITWSSRACLVCCVVVVVVVLFPVYTINHDPPAVKWCCCWSSTAAAFVHWRGVLCGGNGTGSAQFANNLKLFCRLVFLRVLWNWLCTCYVRASSVWLAGWLADSSSRRRLVLFPSRPVDIERPTEVRGIIFIPASIFNYPCRSAMPVSQSVNEWVGGWSIRVDRVIHAMKLFSHYYANLHSFPQCNFS